VFIAAKGLQCGASNKCEKIPAPVAAGASCYQMSGSSGASLQCVSGYYCNIKINGTATSGVCEVLPGKGEACSSRCASGFDCNNKVCVAPVAEGGACPNGHDCAEGLSCDMSSKTCKAGRIIGAGEGCGVPGMKCGVGLACDYNMDMPVCKALLGENAACGPTVDARCGALLSCVDGKCQFPDANLCK
jgi:hypothetical protein